MLGPTKRKSLYLMIDHGTDPKMTGTILLQEGKDTGGWTIDEYASHLDEMGIPYSYGYPTLQRSTVPEIKDS
jgi:hypothetical protein